MSQKPLTWTTTETVERTTHCALAVKEGDPDGPTFFFRDATPDDLARLGYVPATPPESKQRVDGFLGTDVVAAAGEVIAKSKQRRTGFLADITVAQIEALRAALTNATAEVERLRGERDALRERYAGLERAAREAMRAHLEPAPDAETPAWEGRRMASRFAIWNAVRALDSAPAPTDAAQPADGRGGKAAEVESHEPADPVLEDAGLRWVRYPTREPPAWELQHCSLGTVWDNGTWHTWDSRGVGGENASDDSVTAAKASVEAALIRQERRPIKGWAVHGFDLDADDGDDEEPAAPSTGGSLWTTPARVGQPPLPEAAVDSTVTREQVVAAIEAQSERMAALRGGFDPDPFGAQKANPPKIPDGSPAPTDAPGPTANYELPWYREGQSVYDAKGDLVAGATSVTDAAFIVARCNTPAPTDAAEGPVPELTPTTLRRVATKLRAKGLDDAAAGIEAVADTKERRGQLATETDAAREAAAEILAAFPRCYTCPAPARFEDGMGVPRCNDHALPLGMFPVEWLPALEVAERIAKGSSQ